jgi:poly [ADP-ribose] polymerase
MARIAKLIMVTDKNNNKYYDMVENADGSITATWGRVDVTKTVTHYPVGKRKWETLYKSKIKKGYVDVTELRTVSNEKVDFANISDRKISKIVRELQGYANKSVKQNYTVSAEAVTQKQIDAAQDILDQLIPLIAIRTAAKKINDNLLELYRVIPRRMKKVQHHLLDFDRVTQGNMNEVQRLIADEQATLDVMRGQVKVSAAQKSGTVADKHQTILDAMGLDILMPSDKDIQLIK